MDDDLEQLTRDELVAELKRLRAGIRRHRDSTGHELCWHHPELWRLLPDASSGLSDRRYNQKLSNRLQFPVLDDVDFLIGKR